MGYISGRLVLGLTLGVFCVASGTSSAQSVANCKGPADLERVVASRPSAAAYDALGAYFGKQNNLSCALSSFNSAIRLEPNSWEGHYDRAIALLASGKPASAAKDLRIASQLEPAMPQIRTALGLALSQMHQTDAAIDEFRTVLKTDPKSITALDGISKALIAEKRYSAAIASLKNAPPDEVLQLNLAIAYSKNGNIDRAIETLTAIVEKHPSYAQAHSNLAIVYTQQSRYHEAAQEFEKALQLEPSSDVDRLSYIKTLIILGQYNAAQPFIQDYLHRKPNDFDALYFAGVVDRGLGKYADAAPLLRQAVALRPNQFDSRYNLGFVLAKLGNAAEARVQLEKALQLQPSSSQARFQLAAVLRSLGQQNQARQELKIFQQSKEQSIKADVAGTQANQANQYLQQGDAQKAVAMYRQSIAEDAGNAHTYYDLALALDRLGDIGGERHALEKALALDSKFAAAHNQLGFLDLQGGQIADAETQFKTAISLNPQYAEAQNNLGVLYGQLGRNQDAERLFRQATENNPQYAQAFVNLGLTQASESSFAEAEQTLHQAIQLAPNNTAALTASGMVLTRLNRGPEAMQYFRRVVALDPKSPGAHLNLGIALADQFDLNGALDEFSEAVRLDPNSPAAYYNQGRVLLDLQRNAQAKPALEMATRLDPKLAESWYLLGLIARQAGTVKESIDDFQKSVALDPENADALYMLGQQRMHQQDTRGAIEAWRRALIINPQYSEVLYNLSRTLMKSEPAEAKQLQARFENLQRQEHITDRAQTLGNFALASANAHDWRDAISQLKEALHVCGECSTLPLLHKDLGLIYCRSGDLTNGRSELLQAQKLSPHDQDVEKALQLLKSYSN